MQALGLTIVELLEIVRVCGSLQLGKCSAGFLSDYLAAGLVALDPDLALRIRHFDEDQLEELSQRVRQLQFATRGGRAHAVPARA